MAKLSKNQKIASEKIDKSKKYEASEALELLKGFGLPFRK